MADRSKLFHRQFPERKINTTLLRRIYKIHGVKKKALKWTKRPSANTLKKFDKLKEQLREEIAGAEAAGLSVAVRLVRALQLAPPSSDLM